LIAVNDLNALRHYFQVTMHRHAALYAFAKATLFGTLFIGAALSGCTSTGRGTGESRTSGVTADFTWKQSEPTSGQMQAVVTMPDGRQDTYEGKFYQITKDSRMETIGPLWDPWYPGWGGWPYWGPGPTDSFIQHYTGHVVANLGGPDGQRMRCHFRLLRSEEGMKGGGQGQCQLPTGQTINAEFPPS
jgi:hypothetical protein